MQETKPAKYESSKKLNMDHKILKKAFYIINFHSL